MTALTNEHVCLARVVECAVVSGASRVQLVRAIIDPGLAHIVGNHNAQHVATKRLQEESR